MSPAMCGVCPHLTFVEVFFDNLMVLKGEKEELKSTLKLSSLSWLLFLSACKTTLGFFLLKLEGFSLFKANC